MCTRLDYFGPLYIRSTNGRQKVWVCLFTCMITRAVHLELIQNMSADEFLLAFKRFIAQRGVPTDIISDNALQFKTAQRTFDLMWTKIVRNESIQNFSAHKRITWKFIVELAPWMGGFYERLVGVVKRSLRKALGRNLFSLIQLQTILKEVESVVNTRRLVYVGDDIISCVTLTPNHFLTLNPRMNIPEVIEENTDCEYNPSEKKIR